MEHTLIFINMINHQKPTFSLFDNFFKSALYLLKLSLKKLSIQQKLNFANHLYFFKGLL
jgi:hypothetical protein